MLKKIIKKVITSVLIAIGSILLWVVLLAATSNDSPRGWTALSVVGGLIAILSVWSTGWSNKPNEVQALDEEKKDLFKIE